MTTDVTPTLFERELTEELISAKEELAFTKSRNRLIEHLARHDTKTIRRLRLALLVVTVALVVAVVGWVG
jgi:hypothetical protein